MTYRTQDPLGMQVVWPPDLSDRLKTATTFFWRKRAGQQAAQGRNGERDRGARSAVTGGKQMDGFAHLVVDLLEMNGVPSTSVFLNKGLELPGYFRATKKWDLVLVHHGHLLAVIEMKSQVGPSFGNNFNNRTEEAVGSATDIWTAYRENAFGHIRRPWLGYLFMLEDCPKSRSAVRVYEPHFPVFPEFRNASYARRYEEMCRRLVRENLYAEAAFLMSERHDFLGVTLKEPAPDLTFRPFAQSLLFSVRISLDSTRLVWGDSR